MTDPRALKLRRISEDKIEGRIANRGLQLIGGALGDDLTVVDDGDPVGELIRLVEILGGEQYGRSGGHQSPDSIPHLRPGSGVKPGRRLVEEDEWWLGDETRREVETATHTAREVLQRAFGGIGQAELFEQFRRFGPRRFGAEAVQAGEEKEVLAGAQGLIDRGILPSDADELAHDMRLAHHIMSEDMRAAAIGAEQRREHTDSGRLPGAVRPEHAIDAPNLYREVNVIDSAIAAEVLDKSMGLDRPISY